MAESQRILEQLKKSFYKEAWHGPAYLETLKGVSAKQAAKNPIADAHSIWEIVLHTTVWIKAVRVRCTGKTFNVSDEQDWPKVTDTSEAAWTKAVAGLKREHKKLEKLVASLKPSDLKKKAGGSSLPNNSMLDSIIHHDIYHAAQIALLKRLT
jgi:uncharacterized damage-inducible protein DinB